MGVKIIVAGSQMVMSEDGRFYRQCQLGPKIFWNELAPIVTDDLGFARLYKVQLTGKDSAYSRYFLVAKYSQSEGNGAYWQLVIDFVERSEVRCFLLDYSLLVMGYADRMYDLANSYVWHDTVSSPEYPFYTKMGTGLPAIKVKEKNLEVLGHGCLIYLYCNQLYCMVWAEKGGFEEIPPDDIGRYSALPR